jgi:hypothetical protein
MTASRPWQSFRGSGSFLETGHEHQPPVQPLRVDSGPSAPPLCLRTTRSGRLTSPRSRGMDEPLAIQTTLPGLGRVFVSLERAFRDPPLGLLRPAAGSRNALVLMDDTNGAETEP